MLKNDGAEAWDLGDGVLGLTFKTKANSIDPDVISMIGQAVEKAETRFPRARHRERGRALLRRREPAARRDVARARSQWDQIGEMVKGYQYATQRMKYARVPVVAAPYGMTLGGGLELCIGADARAGRGRDLLGPRRGRRRPHPRRRRHAQHALALARGRSPRARPRTSTRT